MTAARARVAGSCPASKTSPHTNEKSTRIRTRALEQAGPRADGESELQQERPRANESCIIRWRSTEGLSAGIIYGVSANISMLPLRSAMRSAARQMSTVAVGISGGVDSSVAALLLKEQGHDVIGVHMTNWDAAEEASDSVKECIERDHKDARRICEQLGIGFREVSFVREYWAEVFEPLLEGYHSGGTPNPDVMCNRHIKFDHFMRHALSLGADRVATGHYARLEAISSAGANSGSGSSSGSARASLDGGSLDGGSFRETDEETTVRLLKAADTVKDQTYFLAHVQQAGLRKAIFPLGGMLKSEVRQRAMEANLHTAAKRESMGICFIGKR